MIAAKDIEISSEEFENAYADTIVKTGRLRIKAQMRISKHCSRPFDLHEVADELIKREIWCKHYGDIYNDLMKSIYEAEKHLARTNIAPQDFDKFREIMLPLLDLQKKFFQDET